MAWTEKWQMQFNASKCSVMHLGPNNPRFSYTMGGHAPAGVVLEETVEEKDVGVMIRNDLKSSSQAAKAAKKANQVLGQMARAFHYRDKFTWTRLYKTYVRCHLEYCVHCAGMESILRCRQGAAGEGAEEGSRNDFGTSGRIL